MSKINFDIQDAPFQVGRLVANLRAMGTSIPAELTAGLPYRNGNAIELINQVAPPRDYINEAVEAVNRGEDPDPILALAGASKLRVQVGELIAKQANREYVDKLNDNADLIIRTLSSEVFEPIIDQLRTVHQEHGSQLNLAAAVKAEDFELASIIKTADESVGNINALHEARQLLYSSDGLSGCESLFTDTAAWTREPGAFDEIGTATRIDERRVPNMHRLQWWMDLLDAGYTPHYPTYAEWRQLRSSEAFTEYEAAKAEPDTPAYTGSKKLTHRD